MGGKGWEGSQPGKGAKDLREEKGEDLSGGKGLTRERGERSREEREKIWGKNALGKKGGKRSLRGKGKSFSGENALGGNGGKGSQTGKRGRYFPEEKGEDLQRP